LPLLEPELKAGQHPRVEQPLAARGIFQDGGSLRLIKLERCAQPGGLLSTAITQGREITVIPGEGIQSRQQRRLASVVRPGDQDQAGPGQMHLSFTESPEIFQLQIANRHARQLGSKSLGLSPRFHDNDGSDLNTRACRPVSSVPAAFTVTDDTSGDRYRSECQI
jgi:hypothetical protein